VEQFSYADLTDLMNYAVFADDIIYKEKKYNLANDKVRRKG